MDRDDIIRMAREAASKFAGWDDWDSNKPASGPNGNEPHEEREYWISVVEFIAAAEQDRCCKIVYGMAGSDNVAQRTVDAIRGKE